jgi:muramidase (phage lysozyme)
MSDHPTDHRIVGIHVTDRATAAGKVQEILSKYSKNIRTRLGLHDVHDDVASPNGLILVEAIGTHQEIDALSDELRRLPGIQVQSMFFSHPE